MVAAAVAAGVVLAGCGGGGGPRPVTGEEAQQLALVRLTTYEQSPVALRLRIPGPVAATTVDAVLDFRTRRATGTYRVPGTAGAPAASGALAWDDRTVAVDPDGGGTGWARRAAGRDPLDRALLLALRLGHDRPENAQLLARGGATRLGERRLDGTSYTVFGGPHPPRRPGEAPPAGGSALSYWVDAGGGLRRVEARLTPGAPPVTVDVLGRAAPGRGTAGPQPAGSR